MAAFPSPTKTYHNTSYAAISPTLPALSTAGKSIVITGAGTGIGRAIALSFATSHASNILLLGRRTAPLEETQALLTSSYPATTTHIAAADITDRASLDAAFASFTAATKAPIDILIANAGIDAPPGPLSAISADTYAGAFTANVIGNFNLMQAFLPHAPKQPLSEGKKYRAKVLHTSTGFVHAAAPMVGAYSGSKVAAAFMFEGWAVENPDIFVMNWAPGIVDTPMHQRAKEGGVDLPAMDDVSLAADFAVWAASPEAEFLGSGRFIWAHWDVDELKAIFAKIAKGEINDGMWILGGMFEVNKKFKFGIVGWP